MNTIDKLVAARDQLNRTLTFFSRVDSKASVILGVNTGLLAVLATRAVPLVALRWEWVPIGLTLLLLGISFWNLYRQAFPSLAGGHQSLIYFREIAVRTEPKFIDEWLRMTDDEQLKEILSQVWRNSEILKQKFDHLKWAFYSLALAILPWIVALVALTLRATSR